MASVFIACTCIGLIHLATAQGSYNYYSESDIEAAIGIGAIGLSFSIICLFCIFVGLICVCAKKCGRQPVHPAPGLAFVNAVPGYMPYGQPFMHGQPMMHNQSAMHGQPVMTGQPQQMFNNRDVPQQSSSFPNRVFASEAPSAIMKFL